MYVYTYYIHACNRIPPRNATTRCVVRCSVVHRSSA